MTLADFIKINKDLLNSRDIKEIGKKAFRELDIADYITCMICYGIAKHIKIEIKHTGFRWILSVGSLGLTSISDPIDYRSYTEDEIRSRFTESIKDTGGNISLILKIIETTPIRGL